MASSTSLAVVFLLRAKIVNSLNEGTQPHLLQCAARWPEGEEQRATECSLALTFTHLPLCPMYTLLHVRGIWYTALIVHGTKGVWRLTSQWKSLVLSRLTAEHSRDNLRSTEKTTGALYLLATLLTWWERA